MKKDVIRRIMEIVGEHRDVIITLLNLLIECKNKNEKNG